MSGQTVPGGGVRLGYECNMLVLEETFVFTMRTASMPLNPVPSCDLFSFSLCLFPLGLSVLLAVQCSPRQAVEKNLSFYSTLCLSFQIKCKLLAGETDAPLRFSLPGSFMTEEEFSSVSLYCFDLNVKH